MTTMRVILGRAGRMARAVQLGEDPASEEFDAMLEDAQGFFLTNPIRQLTPVLITANYEAGENERVSFTSGAPAVTYPTTINDNGTTRLPQNGAVVEVSGASGSTRKIYIAELKTWMTLTGLTANSEQPFGPTHDTDVAAMLAVRFCGPVFQANTPEDVIALSQRGRTNIRAAFRQTYPPNFDRALVPAEDASRTLLT